MSTRVRADICLMLCESHKYISMSCCINYHDVASRCFSNSHFCCFLWILADVLCVGNFKFTVCPCGTISRHGEPYCFSWNKEHDFDICSTMTHFLTFVMTFLWHTAVNITALNPRLAPIITFFRAQSRSLSDYKINSFCFVKVSGINFAAIRYSVKIVWLEDWYACFFRDFLIIEWWFLWRTAQTCQHADLDGHPEQSLVIFESF